MAAPTADAYTALAGVRLLRGGRGTPTPPPLPVPAMSVVANGVWTWFTDARAVYRDGATYVGWVTSAGTSGVSKFVHATGVTTNFNLSSIGMERDDHNNPALRFLPDGRLLCVYSKHNDTGGFRVRISTDSSVTAFAAEQVISATTPVSYSNTHYLADSGLVYNHYRSGPGGGGTNPMNVRAFNPASGTWDTQRTWIVQTGQRPYVKSISNGIDRIDFLLTNCHPNEGASSTYHCYMQLDGGVEKFYNSAGTLISGTVTPASCTRIYDGATVDSWVWDIAYAPDGAPCVLFATFPTTSDHRYMYSRWNGSAWQTPVQITAAGTHLYSGEVNYSGGLCFDANNPNIVYLSRQVSGEWEVQKFLTADSGATWTKTADITSGSAAGLKNCRPYSPVGHNGEVSVLWWRGSYSTFTTYNTAIWGVGA